MVPKPKLKKNKLTQYHYTNQLFAPSLDTIKLQICSNEIPRECKLIIPTNVNGSPICTFREISKLVENIYLSGIVVSLLGIPHSSHISKTFK